MTERYPGKKGVDLFEMHVNASCNELQQCIESELLGPIRIVESHLEKIEAWIHAMDESIDEQDGPAGQAARDEADSARAEEKEVTDDVMDPSCRELSSLIESLTWVRHQDPVFQIENYSQPRDVLVSARQSIVEPMKVVEEGLQGWNRSIRELSDWWNRVGQ